MVENFLLPLCVFRLSAKTTMCDMFPGHKLNKENTLPVCNNVGSSNMAKDMV